MRYELPVDLVFASPDLRRIDELRAEACVLPFFRDERPFRGLLGLFDWRMGARLSRQVLRGRIRGERGERLLMPCDRYFPFEKLVLLGLGRRNDFDEAASLECSAAMLNMLDGMRVRVALCSLPGRSVSALPAETAIGSLLEASREKETDLEELIIVDEPAAQRAMEPLIAQERRRQRAG